MLNTGPVWLLTVIVLLLVSVHALRNRMPYWETLLLLVFVAYSGTLIAVTLFPIPIDPRLIRDMASDGYLQNSFIPLQTIRESYAVGVRVFAVQVGGNLALLFPLGLLLPVLWARARKTRVGIAAIAITSLGIECTQLAISAGLGVTYKQFDVDDLVLNIIGGCVGFGCFLLTRWLLSARSRRREAVEARLEAG